MSGRRKKIKGVIFQFNHEAVLFEFQEGDDDAIGVVKPSNITINEKGSKIPSTAKTSEDIAKFINIGDEIEGFVTKEEDLEKFTYLEEEEEITESGETLTSSNEVEILPDWKAESAQLLRTGLKDETLDEEEIDEIEEQLDDIFEEKKKSEESKEKKTGRKGPSKFEPMPGDNEQEDEEAVYIKAVISQLKRPIASAKTKVLTAFLTIQEGKYKDKRAIFSNHTFYVYGHHMNNADFLYHLRAGDEIQAEVYEPLNDKGTIIVKKAFLGPMETTAILPSENKEFAYWLTSRGIDYTGFKNWVKDRVERRPYFPLVGPKYQIQLTRLVKSSGKVHGMAKIVDGDLKDNFVAFDGHDLYLHEVNVGNADIRMLLRVGDMLTCQVQGITSHDKRRFKKVFGDEDEDYNHIAELVFIGEKPRSAMVQPYMSAELLEYLKRQGLDLGEFVTMKTLSSIDGEKTEPQAGSKPNNFQDKGKLSATQLTAKAMMLKSLDDPLIHDLLRSVEEIQSASYLAKVFTQALILKMDGPKDQHHAGRHANVGRAAMETQMQQVNLATKALMHPSSPANRAITASQIQALGMPLPIQQPVSSLNPIMHAIQQNPLTQALQRPPPVIGAPDADHSKAIMLSKQLEMLEAKRKVEEKMKQTQALEKKKEESSKKIKKMLQSYVQDRNSNPLTKKAYENAKKLQQQEADDEKYEQTLTPLELYRFYKSKNKRIIEQDDLLVFGKRPLPRETITNFKITKGSHEDIEFYSLFAIHDFMKHVTMNQVKYEQRCLDNGIPMVRGPDRQIMIDYISGKGTSSPNIVSMEVFQARMIKQAEVTAKRNALLQERKQMEEEYAQQQQLQLQLQQQQQEQIQQQQLQLQQQAQTSMKMPRKSRFDQVTPPNPAVITRNPILQAATKARQHSEYGGHSTFGNVLGQAGEYGGPQSSISGGEYGNIPATGQGRFPIVTEQPSAYESQGSYEQNQHSRRSYERAPESRAYSSERQAPPAPKLSARRSAEPSTMWGRIEAPSGNSRKRIAADDYDPLNPTESPPSSPKRRVQQPSLQWEMGDEDYEQEEGEGGLDETRRAYENWRKERSQSSEKSSGEIQKQVKKNPFYPGNQSYESISTGLSSSRNDEPSVPRVVQHHQQAGVYERSSFRQTFEERETATSKPEIKGFSSSFSSGMS